MQFVLFYHSLISDWNHDNAHYLRGIALELQRRGYQVRVFEPENGWSLKNLTREYGASAIIDFNKRFPTLRTSFYSLTSLDLDKALHGADVVIVHEWTDPELVRRIGNHRLKSDYTLLFHDTHPRAVTDREGISRYELDNFDGVLASGGAIRDMYVRHGWARRAWIWHEAADMTVFHPVPVESLSGDLVWIGNREDEERTTELTDYLIRPVRELGLRAHAFGVIDPDEGRTKFIDAGIRYCGWIPNYRIPEILCRHRMSVHIPRRPIRVFEVLACGVPLVCSRWDDVEGLFTPGTDFLLARNPAEMKMHLRALMDDVELAREIGRQGWSTVVRRHTCAHRVDELLQILSSLSRRTKPDKTRRPRPIAPGCRLKHHSQQPQGAR